MQNDPSNVLLEIKQKLQERIDILRSCIHPEGPIDRLDHHFNNEVEFLSDVLNLIEG
jgi:hypothetical protein